MVPAASTDPSPVRRSNRPLTVIAPQKCLTRNSAVEAAGSSTRRPCSSPLWSLAVAGRDSVMFLSFLPSPLFGRDQARRFVACPQAGQTAEVRDEPLVLVGGIGGGDGIDEQPVEFRPGGPVKHTLVYVGQLVRAELLRSEE